MMNIEIIIALMTFAFVGSVTPGPNNLMLMASGINYGFQRTVPHMLGIGVGFIVMLVLVGLGLGQIFTLYPPLYTALKIISIAYLSYLAWKIATAAAHDSTSATAESGKPFSFLQAALFQWVNPKAWVMTITAISTYMPQAPVLVNVVIVAVIFGLVMVPSISLWVYLGSKLARFLGDARKLRAFNITAAILLMLSLYPVLFH